uniref:Site-specific DNA-methyltransferase (adenine-specific) n=2 Tax=unclassified Prevotella TaxID=2638335 RepID=A0AB33J366_9BACT
MSIVVPPIKSQGIKTKLIPWITDLVLHSGVSENARWIEPFLGTGVVGFNSPLKGEHIVGDTNPHIIHFYNSVLNGKVNAFNMRAYLEKEGRILSEADENGYTYFRKIRTRFNSEHSPFDFIFLSRAGFNGMMRFNRKGEWNVPFCKKPNRFSPSYITKICNQVDAVRRVITSSPWEFKHVGFRETIEQAQKGDLIYCDPPYFGRYTDYFNNWTEQDELDLYEALRRTPANFILSTWHHNQYRENEMIPSIWKDFNIETTEHFYHGGAHIENRHAMTEALVFNFERTEKSLGVEKSIEQELELAFV